MRCSTCFLQKARTADARQLYGAVADRAKRSHLRRRYERSFELAWRTENFGEARQSRRCHLTVPAHMPSIEPLPLVVATLSFLLAGFVKGVIGLGLPTVSMGLLSVVMPPAKAASLLIVPSFVTNVWQLTAGASFTRLAHRLWPMLAGVVARHACGNGIADWQPRRASGRRAWTTADALRRARPHVRALLRIPSGRMVAGTSG